ncbi:Deoxyribonuclease II [Trichostrongylus colubriformis]|uniref:Deoxyribonuclease II n=1 Tax=Trichostrongylus colubriformis TaxID=6319 RepID=A0AAN8INP5_TRICO
MPIVLLAILAFAIPVDARYRCKNMEGNDVDWYVAIKLPANIDERNGRSFAYFDSTQTGWVFSKQPINSTDSAIGATVNQLYNSDNGTTFKIAYNDDCPGKQVDSGRGHSKGVAVFNIESGFWLVHSVPNFPPPGKYDYPETGSKFAQSFVCLSLDANSLEDISQYMRYSQVTPFITNLPKNFETLAPHLVDVVNKKSLGRSDTRFTTSHDIETVGHKRVKFFAKHKKFGRDLWHDFIALYLRTPMAVETWRNGAAVNVGTQCDLNNVYDITSVKVANKEFASSKDHSKWGVSMKESVPAVCIGDVNRQQSQFKRGGGAVCIEDAKLWRTFRGSVNSYLDCGEVQERKTSPKEKGKKFKGKKSGKGNKNGTMTIRKAKEILRRAKLGKRRWQGTFKKNQFKKTKKELNRLQE